MQFIILWLQRIAITCIGFLAILFIVTQIFEPLHHRLPLVIALVVTYFLSAYLLLPAIVHIGVTIVRRGRIPRTTRESDGLPADPINLLLIGSEEQLLTAFKKAGWQEADALNIRTGWKMAIAFALNKPYLQAPFRSLYLFARRQDHGFQISIGESPRKRHHIRFWAANLNPDANPADFHYWSTKHTIDPAKPLIWVGAATEDTGIGFTSLTYQIRHSFDKNIDTEREYILESLRTGESIEDEHYVDSNRVVAGKYISDGRILTATLT
jgi:hypothetical protein